MVNGLVFGTVNLSNESITTIDAECTVDIYPSWTTTGTSGSSTFTGVAYGNGRFVSVGIGGVRQYSTDGINWTNVTPVSSDTPLKIRFINGEFWAPEGVGYIRRSTDGETWSSQIYMANTATVMRDITRGEDMGGTVIYMACGGSGRVKISVDGNAWYTFGTGTSFDLNGIAYGNGKFVVVGASGTVRHGSDAWLTWAGANAGSGVFRSVAYGNGRFVLVGDSGVTRYSVDDGVTWTTTGTISAKSYSDIIFHDNKFFASGPDGEIAVSTDGVNWTITAAGTVSLSGIAYGNNKFAAVGINGAVRYANYNPSLILETGFAYSTSTNPTINDGSVLVSSGIGTVSATLENLAPDTTYYVSAYVKYEDGGTQYAYSVASSETTITAIDGNQYVADSYRLTGAQFIGGSNVSTTEEITGARTIAFFMKDNSVDCGFFESRIIGASTNQITINSNDEFEQTGFTNFVETSETINTWRFVTLEFDSADFVGVILGKTGTDIFTGKLDEFMVFDKILTTAEKTLIKNKFLWNNTDLYNNCLLWWSFDNPIIGDDRGSWEQIFLEEYE